MSEEEITDVGEDNVVLEEEDLATEELPFDIADEDSELGHSPFGVLKDEE